MNILILGGTGAMGRPLVDTLCKNQKNKIYVTSRTPHTPDRNNLEFFQGDAHDEVFLKSVLSKGCYEVIVDFLIYDSGIFKERVDYLLKNTAHYIFFSSARVYAFSAKKLTEDSPRLLDVCEDKAYLESDEYALKKAREEDILFGSSKNNFTIIRPYITCNFNRMQLGFYEKEHWLYRVLQGKPILFPEELQNRRTTLTHAEDLVPFLMKIIEKNTPVGECFHIAVGECVSWKEIIRIYRDRIKRVYGINMDVRYVSSTQMQHISDILGCEKQIKYDRLYDRCFDNSKVISYTGLKLDTDIESTIDKCVVGFAAEGGGIQQSGMGAGRVSGQELEMSRETA